MSFVQYLLWHFVDIFQWRLWAVLSIIKLKLLFRILIRIQHFRLNSDPDFFWINNCLGLQKGRPSSRRSLQPSKRTSSASKVKTWNFLIFSAFVGHFALRDPGPDPLTWLNPDPVRIRIRNSGWNCSYLSPLLPNPSRLQSEGPPEELYSHPTFGRVMRCNAGRRLVKTYRVEGNTVYMRLYERLKVDSNEQRGGSERSHLLSFSLGLWHSR